MSDQTPDPTAWDDNQLDDLLDALAQRAAERDDLNLPASGASRRGVLATLLGAGGLGIGATQLGAAASWGSASGTVGTQSSPIDQANVRDLDAKLLEAEQIGVNKAHTLVAGGSSQSIPDAAFTQVEFNDVFTDELTGWDINSDTFSVPSDGLYEVSVVISFDSAPAGTSVLLVVNIDGSNIVKDREDITQDANMTVAASAARRLTAGETVSVEVLQQSGGSLSTLSGASDTQISITRLG